MGRGPRVKLIDQLIRAKHASEIGDEFYACVIDCLMPDMNGIENVRRIRRVISEDQPIILTANKTRNVERIPKNPFKKRVLFFAGQTSVQFKRLRGVSVKPDGAEGGKGSPHHGVGAAGIEGIKRIEG